MKIYISADMEGISGITHKKIPVAGSGGIRKRKEADGR